MGFTAAIGAAMGSSSSNTFYACKARTGAIGNITTSSKLQCATGHTRVSWNAVGPPGVAGQQGIQGVTGPAGPGMMTWSSPLATDPKGGISATLQVPLSQGWWNVHGYLIDGGGCSVTATSNAESHLGWTTDGLNGMILMRSGGGSVTVYCVTNKDGNPGVEQRMFIDATQTLPQTST